MKALFIFGWMLLCSFSSAQVKIGGDPKIIHPHSLLELKSKPKIWEYLQYSKLPF
jgi:hypothetical protein